MKIMKKGLVNKIFEKTIYSLGENSIKVSENAMGKCMSSFIYEPKIPIELLKASINKYIKDYN